MKRINFKLLCEFPYVSIGSVTFDLELEKFIKNNDRIGCINFLRAILKGAAFTDKYGDVIQLQTDHEREEFKKILLNDYQFNKVCQHLGISAHKLFLIPKGSFKQFHEATASRIAGPALIDKQGNLLIKGRIGQSHSRLAEIVRDEAKEAGNWGLAMDIIKILMDDRCHVFVDEDGNILNRKEAAEAAVRNGQADPKIQYLQSHHLHEDAMTASSGGVFGNFGSGYANGDARVPGLLMPIQRRFKVRRKRKKKARK